jgi:hypothetical protein
MTTISKVHHYVPQFYLRNFLAPGETKLVATSLEPPSGTSRSPRFGRFAPRRLAAIDHLYTDLNALGEPDVALEQAFSALESYCAPTIAKFQTPHYQPSRADHDRLSMFLGSLQVRHPRHIMESTGGPVPTGLCAAQTQLKQPFRAMQQPAARYASMLLSTMTLRIYYFSTPSLITSDTPMFVLSMKDFEQASLEAPAAAAFVPLNPSCIAVLSGDDVALPPAVPGQWASGDLIPWFRCLTIHFCWKQVFSREPLADGELEAVVDG